MSEGTDRGGDTERCCIAHRPASVNRVITTVEAAHNTERQREEEGESNRQKKEEIEKNTLLQAKKEWRQKLCLT